MNGKASAAPRVAKVTLNFQLELQAEHVQRVAALIDELEKIPAVRVHSTVFIDGVQVSIDRLRQT